MGKYRKKPLVIEATQWFKNGDHPDDNPILLQDRDAREYFANGQPEGRVVRYYRNPEDDGQRRCKHCGNAMHDHGWIDDVQGGHVVCPGDWIIEEAHRPGKYYPCKPEAFAATYEAVEEI